MTKRHAIIINYGGDDDDDDDDDGGGGGNDGHGDGDDGDGHDNDDGGNGDGYDLSWTSLSFFHAKTQWNAIASDLCEYLSNDSFRRQRYPHGESQPHHH